MNDNIKAIAAIMILVTASTFAICCDPEPRVEAKPDINWKTAYLWHVEEFGCTPRVEHYYEKKELVEIYEQAQLRIKFTNSRGHIEQ